MRKFLCILLAYLSVFCIAFSEETAQDASVDLYEQI